MKTGGTTKVAVNTKTVSETKTRKSLHPLQPAATDKENLVGAGRQLRSSTSGKDSIKNAMSDKMKGDTKKTPVKKTEKIETEKKVTKTIKPKSDPKKVVKDIKKNGKIFKDTAIQTDTLKSSKVSVEDLTSQAGPSESYWQILAERRRVALEDALEENKILSEQVAVYKEMLDESRALVEVLKDMIGDDGNDINNSLDDSRL